jgi:hypothetical protein
MQNEDWQALAVVCGAVISLLVWALTVAWQRLNRGALIERIVLSQRKTIRELWARLKS